MFAAPYVLSFTAGGLLFHESIAVAEVQAASDDWGETVNRVERENLLQSRVTSTTNRKLREIRKRLTLLTDQQLHVLADGSRSEQAGVLWLACCKRYELLRDFASEVLRDKLTKLDLKVSTLDVDRFIEAKSVWHAELDRLADSTRNKLQTVIVRMMREAGLTSRDNVLQPKFIPPALAEAIVADNPDWLRCFLMLPADAKRFVDQYVALRNGTALKTEPMEKSR